jgi:threonyl-tRNA synthetase
MEYPDHRRLGRQLKIFATDELCGAGLPLWLSAGAAIRGEIERFIVDLERRHGYHHVYTPEMAKRELYERSDHWSHYRDDMYPPMDVGGEQVVLRPMNCPHHILVFASEGRTAREVPFRLAELGTMFRFERSGVVGGLSRVRQMTLNDGHVFCAADQVGGEIASILGLVDEAYRALAIPAPSFRLSLRGPGPKYVGDPVMWDQSEAMLRTALDNLGLDYEEGEGQAAFYGPKIDLQVQDPQGREETLSTVQVDFHLPARFGLEFQRGPMRERPVMVHRSIVSTMERMVAHLLEVHDGALPVWLAPTQVVILPVVEDAISHARGVRAELLKAGVRVELDDRDATLGARVRDAQQRRVPYAAVIGRREAASGTVSVRLRSGDQMPPATTVAFVALVGEIIATRSPHLRPEVPVG